MGNYHCCPDNSCGAGVVGVPEVQSKCGDLVEEWRQCPTTTYPCRSVRCCVLECDVDDRDRMCTDYTYTDEECEKNGMYSCGERPVEPDYTKGVKGEASEDVLDPPYQCCPTADCGADGPLINTGNPEQPQADRATCPNAKDPTDCTVDKPFACKSCICCADQNCYGGCFFGEYTEAECTELMGMYVCQGIGT